ncbi:MAG: 30S ribosomal protein S16 [Ilumatobacteraceae bacterium]
MSVKLRLTRVGKTKQPHYRIVAADTRNARDGKFLEIVGNYHPKNDPSVLSVDNVKAIKWLKQGALPSERVKKLLEISGAWAEFSASKTAK